MPEFRIITEESVRGEYILHAPNIEAARMLAADIETDHSHMFDRYDLTQTDYSAHEVVVLSITEHAVL